jgi:hypothetical protein
MILLLQFSKYFSKKFVRFHPKKSLFNKRKYQPAANYSKGKWARADTTNSKMPLEDIFQQKQDL